MRLLYFLVMSSLTIFPEKKNISVIVRNKTMLSGMFLHTLVIHGRMYAFVCREDKPRNLQQARGCRGKPRKGEEKGDRRERRMR